MIIHKIHNHRGESNSKEFCTIDSLLIHTLRISYQYKYYVFIVCPNGSYLNADNGNTCELCPVNTFGAGTDAPSCTSCPDGTSTQTLTGQTADASCGMLNNFFSDNINIIQNY